MNRYSKEKKILKIRGKKREKEAFKKGKKVNQE